MSLPNDSLDLDLVLLDFPAAYAENPLDALAMLQCMLLNEDLIAARQEYMGRLAAREGMSVAAGGNFAHEINLICDTGLSNYFRAGSFTEELVQRLHRLSCDPAALRLAHRRLLQPPASPVVLFLCPIAGTVAPRKATGQILGQCQLKDSVGQSKFAVPEEIALRCFDKAQEEVELTLVAESEPERPGLLVPFVEIKPAPCKDGLTIELLFKTPEGSLARKFLVPKTHSPRLATASAPGEPVPPVALPGEGGTLACELRFSPGGQASTIVPAELWRCSEGDWKRIRGETVGLSLEHYGGVEMAIGAALESKPRKPTLKGGSVRFSLAPMSDVFSELVQLELRLFRDPQNCLRLQASLRQGDQPARRSGQRLVLQSGANAPIQLALSYGGSFEAVEGSPDPFLMGLTEDRYDLTLQIPAEALTYEVRLGTIDFANLARLVIQPTELA